MIYQLANPEVLYRDRQSTLRATDGSRDRLQTPAWDNSFAAVAVPHRLGNHKPFLYWGKWHFLEQIFQLQIVSRSMAGELK